MNFLQLIGILITLVSGPVGVYAFTEIAKKSPKFSLVPEGDANKIRSFATLLSTVVAGFTAWTQGALTGPDIQNIVVTFLAFISSLFGAHGIHKMTKKPPSVEG